jgi:hypothetical protein
MAKSVVIPWELKYDFAMKIWASNHRGFLYALREKYGATAALEIFEKVQKGDRLKNLTNTIRTIFKLKGNDAATLGEVIDRWDELTRTEYTILERSPTINRRKVTQCPFKTGYEDISRWSLTLFDIMGKIINPKATLERPKAMCAGDPYCEYVWKLEESIQLKEAADHMTEEVVIPWKLKYDFAMDGWISNHKGHLYAIREEYGAAAAIGMYERFCKMGDRLKNLTNTLLKIFKIEGNDLEAIEKWWNIFYELIGIESTILERSPTINRRRVTKCPHKTEPKDISDWDLPFANMITMTINPKVTFKRPKAMCAGDPYCEEVYELKDD